LTLYEKYHKKGLEVIGLSADTDPRKWKIGMLDIPWLNVSDLKGDKGIVQQVYREFPNPGQANTANILLDSEGRIIAWDANGLELQWYLSNLLGD